MAAKSELKHLMNSLESLYDDLGLSPEAESQGIQATDRTIPPSPASSDTKDHPAKTWNAFYTNYINVIQNLQSKSQGPMQTGRPRKGSDPTGGRQRYTTKVDALAKAVRGELPSPSPPQRRPSWLENYTALGSAVRSGNKMTGSPVSLSATLPSQAGIPSPQPQRRRPSLSMLFNPSNNNSTSMPKAPPPKAPLPQFPILTAIPELSAPPAFAKWRRRRGSKMGGLTVAVGGMADGENVESCNASTVAAAEAAGEVSAILSSGSIVMIGGDGGEIPTSPVTVGLPTSPTSPLEKRRMSLLHSLRPHGQLRG
ncbi:hypothetical protein BC829DRAFT_440780 [Chytridium lagenaria]|nr:hypothetical protein BC829DRAFT_440780 [Chytridium lagenaria]